MADDKEVLKKINEYLSKKQYREALKFLETCGVNEPEIYNMKGIVYMNLNDPVSAEKMYSIAISNAKKSRKRIPHFFYSNRAFALLRLGKVKNAFADMKTALAIAPNEAKLFDMYATIYVSVGEFKNALNILDEGLKHLPGSPLLIKKKKDIIELSKNIIDPYTALIDTASQYIKKKEPRSALQVLENAKQYGETAELYEMIARCYWDLEKHKQGYETVSKAIKLAQDNETKAEYLWIKAKFANTLHNKEEAVDLCRQAVKFEKKAQYIYDLSFYFMLCRKNKQALDSIDTAIKFNPTNPHYYIRKGDILSHMGRIDESIKMYEKAISCDPLLKLAYERRMHAYNVKKYNIGTKNKTNDKGMFG